MDSITLDTLIVTKNAREYYDKGLLTAQIPDAAKSYCINFAKIGETVYRCAVAASYPAEWHRTDVASTFNTGIKEGVIIVEKTVDISNISLIQYSHDRWATARREGAPEEVIADLKEAFLRMISHPDSYKAT